MRLKSAFAALVAVTALVLPACSGAGSGGGSAEDYPSKDLDWTIAFGPGGGNDLMARKLVQVIQEEKLYPADIAVENREGGSGATGWGYLLSKRGSGYDVSTTSGSFLTTPLQANPISFSAAVISNFTWNRLWTYPESRKFKKRTQLPKFALVNLVGLAINQLVLGVVLHLVQPSIAHPWDYNFAKAFAIGVVLFWNFGVNRLWTYRDI